MYASPHPNTSNSSDSGMSMNKHAENATPPESPVTEDFPEATTAAHIGGLSLESNPQRSQSQDGRGRGLWGAAQATNPKRSASSELPRPPGKQFLHAIAPGNMPPAGKRNPKYSSRWWQGSPVGPYNTDLILQPDSNPIFQD